MILTQVNGKHVLILDNLELGVIQNGMREARFAMTQEAEKRDDPNGLRGSYEAQAAVYEHVENYIRDHK